MINFIVRRMTDGVTVFEGESRWDCEQFIERGDFRDNKTTADDCEIVPDEIAGYRTIDDVKEVAPDLTDAECRDVLRMVMAAEGYGIDSVTLDRCSEIVRSERPDYQCPECDGR